MPIFFARGSISSASSICCAAKSSDVSNMPVTWPPGRARLAAKPKLTGSVNEAPTIGIAPGARFTSRMPAVVPVMMMSGLSRTNSWKSVGRRATAPSPYRASMM
jgi:hypothetical protein